MEDLCGSMPYRTGSSDCRSFDSVLNCGLQSCQTRDLSELCCHQSVECYTYATRVKSLSNILRDVEDIFPERSLTDEQKDSLQKILEGSNGVLLELNRILDNYSELGNKSPKNLGTKSRRFWKKLTFEPNDVRDLRSRLESNIGFLNAFMSSALL